MILRGGSLSIASLWLLGLLTQPSLVGQETDGVSFTIERTVAHSGFDGEMCWVHARAGAVPAEHSESSDDPLVVMTMQKLLLSGSDVFYALNQSHSRDLGESWSEPAPIEGFHRHRLTGPIGESAALPIGVSIAPDLLQVGDETTVCDFTPKWHAETQRLLGIGHTVWYRDNRVMHVRPRGIAYAVYDPRSAAWSDWKVVKRILVPERGARLGNFGVVEVSPTETWVTAAEWMQPRGVAEHGSDNSVFVAKLKFNRPDRSWNNHPDDNPDDAE